MYVEPQKSPSANPIESGFEGQKLDPEAQKVLEGLAIPLPTEPAATPEVVKPRDVQRAEAKPGWLQSAEDKVTIDKYNQRINGATFQSPPAPEVPYSSPEPTIPTISSPVIEVTPSSGDQDSARMDNLKNRGLFTEQFSEVDRLRDLQDRENRMRLEGEEAEQLNTFKERMHQLEEERNAGHPMTGNDQVELDYYHQKFQPEVNAAQADVAGTDDGVKQLQELKNKPGFQKTPEDRTNEQVLEEKYGAEMSRREQARAEAEAAETAMAAKASEASRRLDAANEAARAATEAARADHPDAPAVEAVQDPADLEAIRAYNDTINPLRQRATGMGEPLSPEEQAKLARLESAYHLPPTAIPSAENSAGTPDNESNTMTPGLELSPLEEAAANEVASSNIRSEQDAAAQTIQEADINAAWTQHEAKAAPTEPLMTYDQMAAMTDSDLVYYISGLNDDQGQAVGDQLTPEQYDNLTQRMYRALQEEEEGAQLVDAENAAAHAAAIAPEVPEETLAVPAETPAEAIPEVPPVVPEFTIVPEDEIPEPAHETVYQRGIRTAKNLLIAWKDSVKITENTPINKLAWGLGGVAGGVFTGVNAFIPWPVSMVSRWGVGMAGGLLMNGINTALNLSYTRGSREVHDGGDDAVRSRMGGIERWNTEHPKASKFLDHFRRGAMVGGLMGPFLGAISRDIAVPVLNGFLNGGHETASSVGTSVAATSGETAKVGIAKEAAANAAKLPVHDVITGPRGVWESTYNVKEVVPGYNSDWFSTIAGYPAGKDGFIRSLIDNGRVAAGISLHPGDHLTLSELPAIFQRRIALAAATNSQAELLKLIKTPAWINPQ